MRSLNFRDYVLWPIAYKMGLDPATNFEDIQAKAIGTYINSWVRRLFTNADWPEWEVIDSFVPVDHFVTYEQPPPTPGGLAAVKRSIGKVLSVHLIDPRTTSDPSDTVFTESEQGVHVGYEHGTSVWIKYLPACPVYTADSWDSGRTYRKGEVTYSPTTGECYSSKVNGNRNHDPALDTNFGTRPLPPQNLQSFIPASPGFDALNKIVKVFMVPTGDISIPDPPGAGQVFNIRVSDVDDVELFLASETADGVETLAAILDLLTADLSGGLGGGFTVTNDHDELSIQIESASDFNTSSSFSPTGSPSASSYMLTVNQIQSFVPEVPAINVIQQKTTLVLTDRDVRPSALYTVNFTDPNGIEHPASYVASRNDSASQILAGIIASIQRLGGNDPVLASVGTTLDTATATATFTTSQEFGVDAMVEVAGSLWWDMVPFPFELIDPVVRGANSDVLKEWGQTDKGTAEEQAVPTEAGSRLSVPSQQQFTPLTERTRTKSRYALR